MTRRELLWASSGCALVAVGFLLVAAGHGALGVSRNDDWTYYRLVFDMAEHGRFAPDPYTQAMVIGQALMAQPVIAVFGTEIAPLQVLVAVLGSVGILATYVVVRSFLALGQTVIALGVLVLGPIYGSAATSFMTDVPAFAFQALALAAALKALRPERLDFRWLAAAYALCLVAFSIREYAAAAALAITVTLLWAQRSRGLGWARLLALPALWLVLAAALFLARSSVTGGGAREPLEEMLSVATLRHAARTVATLALLVLPVAVPIVAVVVGIGSQRRRVGVGSGLVTVAVGAAGVVWAVPEVRPLGNYLTAFGSYPETLAGPQTRVWPDPVWHALAAAMLVAAVLLTWLVVRSVFRKGVWGAAPGSGNVGATLSLTFALSVVVVTIGVTTVAVGTPFDRYLLPATPYAAAAALYGARLLGGEKAWTGPTVRVATVLALTSFASVGLRTVDASATLDGAKWRLGEQVTAQGFEAATVDAGLEWFGMHQAAPIVVGENRDGRFGFWVTRLVEEPRVCVAGAYAAGLPPGVRPLATETAQSWTGVRYDLAGYRANLACPAG